MRQGKLSGKVEEWIMQSLNMSFVLLLQKEAKEGKKDKDSDKEDEDSGKWEDRDVIASDKVTN